MFPVAYKLLEEQSSQQMTNTFFPVAPTSIILFFPTLQWMRTLVLNSGFPEKKS
jgi:hypothetical protein